MPNGYESFEEYGKRRGGIVAEPEVRVPELPPKEQQIPSLLAKVISYPFEGMEQTFNTLGAIITAPWRMEQLGELAEEFPVVSPLPGGRGYKQYLQWKGSPAEPSMRIPIPTWKQWGAWLKPVLKNEIVLRSLGIHPSTWEEPERYEWARMGLGEMAEFAPFILLGGGAGKEPLEEALKLATKNVAKGKAPEEAINIAFDQLNKKGLMRKFTIGKLEEPIGEVAPKVPGKVTPEVPTIAEVRPIGEVPIEKPLVTPKVIKPKIPLPEPKVFVKAKETIGIGGRFPLNKAEQEEMMRYIEQNRIPSEFDGVLVRSYAGDEYYLAQYNRRGVSKKGEPLEHPEYFVWNPKTNQFGIHATKPQPWNIREIPKYEGVPEGLRPKTEVAIPEMGKIIPEKGIAEVPVEAKPPTLPVEEVPIKPPVTAISEVEVPILTKVEKMWVAEVGKTKGDFIEKSATFWRTLEEKTTDKFAGINKLTTRAKILWKKTHPTEEFPIILDAELRAANLGGAAAGGVQRAVDTFARVKSVLGKDTPIRFVDDYLHLKHNLDVLAMHPKRMVSGGLKGVDEINSGLKELETLLGKENFARVETAAKEITNHWATYLQRGVDSGLVSKDLAELLRTKYPNYNPIAYIERIAAEEGTGTGRALSVNRNDIRALSEMGNEAARERPLDTLARVSIQKEILIQRNNAAKSLVGIVKQDQQLLDQTGKLLPSQRGTIAYMENGVRKTIEVPKWLEKEAKLIGQLGIGDLEKLGMVLNAASRFGMTTANLAFFIPNMAVDTLTAMLTYGVGPARILKRLALNLKDIVIEDKVLAEIRRSGGEVFGFWGKTPEKLATEARKQGILVLQNKWDWKRIMGLPFETITKIGHAVEMTPRSAIFELELKRGKLLEQAALAARRGTIDFQRSGTAIRQANALFLYLNAGVQGAMIPLRALRDSPRARIFTAGFLGAIIGTYTWNRQFPEYEDIPDYYKYGALPIMLPSEEYDKRGIKVPHFILVIPNLREWAFFSGPLTYVMRKLDKQSPDDMGQFLAAWLPPLNPVQQIVGQGGLPVPTQIAQTLTEVGINRDTFRNRDIVPEEFINLPPAEQYNEWTTLTARHIGKVLGFSPMKIDFLIRGIFGGIGTQFLSATDTVIRAIEDEGGDSKIQLLLMQLEGIQENSPPDKIPARRTDFLESLSPEDREAVLRLEISPENRIPIFSDIFRRVYQERGGQIYDTARRNIKNALDNDKSLETAQEELNRLTLQNALNFTNGLISGQQYRDILKNHRLHYGGRTAETWRLRELAGAIATADVQPYLPEEYQWKPEERALQNYYQTIDNLFTELGGAETDENVSFLWRKVDAYVNSLSPELKDYIQRHKNDWINELPPEAQRVQKMYETDIDYIGDTGYWDIPTMEEQRNAGKKAVDLRGQAREGNPQLDADLAFWFDYITTLKTPQTTFLLQQKAQSIGRPLTAIPALKGKSIPSILTFEEYGKQRQ